MPQDIVAGRPDPSSWGPATARFVGGAGGCDIDAFFRDNQLVFDMTFCGDWAGNADVWDADAVCRAKAATCVDYVANNPGDFGDAYWEINSIKIYQPQPLGYQRFQGQTLGNQTLLNQTRQDCPPSQQPARTAYRRGPVPSDARSWVA